MPKRTDTTERVLEYLKGYIYEHNKSPEMCEIKEHFGFSGMGAVYYHIKRLERESRIVVGCIRGMKKFSDIKVKGAKMRNLDAFNAMSREGQKNALIEFLSAWANIEDTDICDYVREHDEFWGAGTYRDEFIPWNANRIDGLAEDILDWLYRQAE